MSINKNSLIADIARIDIKSSLSEMVEKLLKDFDQKETPEQMDYISNRLYQFMLQQHLQKMPWGFVGQAFERGLAGEYGTGKVSVRTLYKWIDEAHKSWKLSKSKSAGTHQERNTPHTNMQQHMSFLFENIDKLPSLKALYETHKV